MHCAHLWRIGLSRGRNALRPYILPGEVIRLYAYSFQHRSLFIDSFALEERALLRAQSENGMNALYDDCWRCWFGEVLDGSLFKAMYLFSQVVKRGQHEHR